jgi:hypothetical protein
MLRASRPFAALLAAATLALPAVADARVVSASFEARLVVVASCSVNVAGNTRVSVDCASPATPYRLSGAGVRALDSSMAPSLRVAGPDEQRVTVYF